MFSLLLYSLLCTSVSEVILHKAVLLLKCHILVFFPSLIVWSVPFIHPIFEIYFLMFLGSPSVCPIFMNAISQERSREFIQIWPCSLGLMHELIRFGGSKVTVTTENIFSSSVLDFPACLSAHPSLKVFGFWVIKTKHGNFSVIFRSQFVYIFQELLTVGWMWWSEAIKEPFTGHSWDTDYIIFIYWDANSFVPDKDKTNSDFEGRCLRVQMMKSCHRNRWHGVWAQFDALNRNTERNTAKCK